MRRKAWTFNVSVDFWDHHKSVAAGRDGRDLFLCAIGWSGKERTNGHVPSAALPNLAGKVGLLPPAARKAAAKLVEVGMWEPEDGGWLIHDYTGPDGWQLSAEEREAQATASAERKRKSRESQGASRVTSAAANPVTGPVTEGVTDAQRVRSHPDSGFSDLVQSSSQGGPGGVTTTTNGSRHPEAIAACRILAEQDLSARRAEQPRNAPPADDPVRCASWLVTGTERRWDRHADQAQALAVEGLDAAAIAARLVGQPPVLTVVQRPALPLFQSPEIEPDTTLNTTGVRSLRSILRAPKSDPE